MSMGPRHAGAIPPLVMLVAGLAACGGSGHSEAGAPTQPAPTSRPTSTPVPTTGSVLGFRPGPIDTTGYHGYRDARLLSGGRLAVLTGGSSSCPPKPDSITGSGRQVTVTFKRSEPVTAICTANIAPFTATFALPRSVDRDLPLQVTVQPVNDGFGYTVAAR